MKIHKDQVVVNTKVPADAHARMMSICKEKDLTIYKFLQMVIDMLLLAMDGWARASDDIRRIIRLFNGMKGWSNCINVADTMKDAQATEAVYFLRRPNKTGERLVMVSPIMGDPMATYNVQTIVERVIEAANPSLYRHLRLVALDMGTESMLDTLGRLADLHSENPDERELIAMFESNNWAENAKRVDTDTRYKRKVTTSMEDFERQLQMEYL